jgi:HK97 family phage prohead protease
MTTTIDAAQLVRPPRDELFRALSPGIELRDGDPDADGADARPVLFGHFARFNEWTEIDSFFEGRFLERIAPGAFKKTMREQTPRVLFNHGRDVTLGNTILGDIEELREDDEGAYYEVRLFDGIPDLLMDGLRNNAYGASFRFRVVREGLDQKPKPSLHNQDGIPERTIKEAQLLEFGPVTFPAYEGATAGVRSWTDDFHFMRLAGDHEYRRRLITFTRTDAAAEPHAETGYQPLATVADVRDTEEDTSTIDAPSTEGAGPQAHPARERRVTKPTDPGDLSWIRGENTPKRSSLWNP